jgi:hypothetical protein
LNLAPRGWKFSMGNQFHPFVQPQRWTLSKFKKNGWANGGSSPALEGIFTTRGQSSSIGANFTPEDQSSPLGARLKTEG